MRDYTRRFLTVPGDKLPAIAGITAEYGKFFGSNYVAGLWEYSLLSELMWCSNRADITRPLGLRSPSWSWVSVDGEINHDWCPLNLGHDAPDVLVCNVEPVLASSPYGSIDATRSKLRIAGDIVRVYWQANKRYIYETMYDGLEGAREIRKIIGRTQADALELVPQDGDHTVVWVLSITKNPIRGLLLAHIDGDRFRRVGLVQRLWDESAVSDHFEKRTITIH